VALAAPLSGWSPSVGVNKETEVLAVGAGVLLLWLGIRILLAGVQVTGQRLTIRNSLRTRTVNASDIRFITLQQKRDNQGGGSWTPRVDLMDGTSIWITGLGCGGIFGPPDPERVEAVDEVRKLLGI
jgi:hypothetical protein